MLPGWCWIAIAALEVGNGDSWCHMCAFRFHFWDRKLNWNQASHVRASSEHYIRSKHLQGRPTGSSDILGTWSPKSQCLRPGKWDCCSDFFCEKCGEHGCWLKVSSPACMLPIFAKAPCCLELFWVLLSQAFATWRGWGLLAGCFFLCLRWQWIVLSRLGVALLSFVLGSPLRPPRLLTRQLCGSGCVCRPEFSIIRLKNNSIYLKPDESFVYIGGRVSISWLQQIA